jgi:hypothetical protein
MTRARALAPLRSAKSTARRPRLRAGFKKARIRRSLMALTGGRVAGSEWNRAPLATQFRSIASREDRIGISLRLTLSAADWDPRIGGWKCEALLIPGSQLRLLFVQGLEAGPRDYRVETGVIYWNKDVRPKEVVAEVTIDKDLQAIETENRSLSTAKDTLEQQKLELENRKFRSDRFWKALSAAGGVLGILLGYAVKHFEGGATTKAATEPQIATFQRANDFLSSSSENSFRAMLAGTKRETWFAGTSFYISTDQFRDELIERARAGIDMHFLVFDPTAPTIKTMSQVLDILPESVTEQCITGLRSLQAIRKSLQASGSTGQIQVRLSQIPFSSRLYFFDPKIGTGSIYFVPQVSSVSSQNSPGFLIRNEKAPFSNIFFDGISKLWNSSTVTDFDAWLKLHPDFAI